MKREEIENEIESIKDRLTDLQNQLEEKPKFEEGWYYAGIGGTKYLVYLFSENASGSYDGGYGFYLDKFTWMDWGTGGSWSCIDRKATPQEVEEALIKEAKKRGFKEGVEFNEVDGGVNRGLDQLNGKVGTAGFETIDGGLHVLGYNKWCVFKDGKWAEIIENKITLNGYDMKQDGDIISFGCAKFDYRWFEKVLNNLDAANNREKSSAWRKGNRKIKSITLDSGVEISIEKLKEIVDNIK